MTTLQEAAMREAFEAHWLKVRGAKNAKHELVRHPLQPQVYIQDSANRHWVTWQAALAQQDESAQVQYLKSELAHALAQHREQQPVCHGCGIPAGDVHMSTCKSGKWPSRVSNGDTAAPAPQAQEPAPQPAQGEPVYQYQMADGSWIDQIKDSYDYNRKYAPNATVRVVYTAAPAPAPAPQPVHQGERAELIRRLYAIANTEANEVADALNEAADMLQSAQPTQEPLRELTEPQVHGIAHRKATRYTYIAKPSEVMYGFSETHIVDFVRAIEGARGE